MKFKQLKKEVETLYKKRFNQSALSLGEENIIDTFEYLIASKNLVIKERELFSLGTKEYSVIDMARFACYLGVKKSKVYERLKDYLEE